MSETLLRAYYAAYNAEDAAALAALLADDVVLVSAVGEQAGRDAYLATYRWMIGAFVDRMTPERIDVLGDVVTVAIRDELVARADIADFMGRPVAAGERITLRLTGRYTIEEGRIARIEIGEAA